MAETAVGRIRRRVLVPQALGSNEHLRATWHEDDKVIVFSHWHDDRCVAATPVRITDTPELASLLIDAIGGALQRSVSDTPVSTARIATPQRGWQQVLLNFSERTKSIVARNRR